MNEIFSKERHDYIAVWDGDDGIAYFKLGGYIMQNEQKLYVYRYDYTRKIFIVSSDQAPKYAQGDIY